MEVRFRKSGLAIYIYILLYTLYNNIIIYSNIINYNVICIYPSIFIYIYIYIHMYVQGEHHQGRHTHGQ